MIVSCEAHAVWHEAGGSAANAGVQLTEIGARGVFTTEEFLAAIKPRDHPIYPPTTLVQVENTHNRAGGIVFPQDEAVRICAGARKLGIASYLDGARLWNVAAATGSPLSELAAPFDVVGVSLSKGLGAPGGSLLTASCDVVARAIRHRRMMGGAMRQVGIFAAAGIFALENNMARLLEDHANARLIADRLAKSRRIVIDPATVQTNILVFGLAPDAPDAMALVAKARERGVLINAFGPRTVRAVTHLDVSIDQCVRAADVLVELADPSRDPPAAEPRFAVQAQVIGSHLYRGSEGHGRLRQRAGMGSDRRDHRALVVISTSVVQRTGRVG